MNKPLRSIELLNILASFISISIIWNQPVFAQENYKQPTIPTGEAKKSISTEEEALSNVSTATKSINSITTFSTGIAIGTTGYDFKGADVTAVVAAKYQNISVSLDLVNIYFTQSKKSGDYYRQTFNNGQSRCRSSSTGRFATNASCSGSTTTEFSYLHQADLTYAIPISQNRSSILLGAAVNFAEDSQAYGVVGYTQNNAYLKAFIGRDNISLRLGTLFN